MEQMTLVVCVVFFFVRKRTFALAYHLYVRRFMEKQTSRGEVEGQQ